MSVKKQIIYRRRRAAFGIILLMIFALIITIAVTCGRNNIEESTSGQPAPQTTLALETTPPPATAPEEPDEPITAAYPTADDDTRPFDWNTIDSDFGVLVDLESRKILAQRNGNEMIYPASLTKIMTLAVAVEHIDNLDDTFTMTYEILAPLIREDATRAGFVEGEHVRIEDMLYGAILPSGADATIGLAEYISGSEEAFVELMNEKAKELGLKNTHFMNTSGLHHGNHYSTPTDMAVILEYALKNETCRNILSRYQYTTSPTKEHPEGIELTSTMFGRMYGTEVDGVIIFCGKTGYTTEAGHCLASAAEKDGKEYIAVTIKGHGKYKPIYDSFEIYERYLPESEIETTVETTVPVTEEA